MKVILAQSAGFCWGVQRAVELARSTARQHGAPVHSDGPLIHNDQMIAQLRAEGIRATESPESLGGGVLLIRAHGIPPDRRSRLRQLPVRLVDATCPDVAKIQGLIRQHAARGFLIVIFGDPGHAEVTGLLGYAGERGFVVSSVDDVARIPDADRVCLVAQSTQFPFAYRRVADAVRRRFPDAEVLDTICQSTRNRQEELVAIAGQVDALVVVGGAHSANTVRLVELARSLRPTVHIQTADQLVAGDFQGCATVGLTAGASTPAFIIEEARQRLEGLPAAREARPAAPEAEARRG